MMRGSIGVGAACGATLASLCMAGCVSVGKIPEPDPAPSLKSYASNIAMDTKFHVVEYVPPANSFSSPVMRVNPIGELVSDGYVESREIIAREFGKVARSNFAMPTGSDDVIAIFDVSIDRMTMRRVGKVVNANLEVTIKVCRKGNGGEVAYCKHFSATSHEEWLDSSLVPTSFYVALHRVIHDFLTDWGMGCALPKLEEWSRGKERPPALKRIDFTLRDGVYYGVCEVACNDYEGFRAKRWAIPRIGQACRDKLGVETERVRVVQDVERLDEHGKLWRFEFRTFVRSRVVMSFDKGAAHGFVTGDLGLMGKTVETASAELRKFVKDEMDKRTGGAGEMLRFDDVLHDSSFDLVTIRFRLLTPPNLKAFRFSTHDGVHYGVCEVVCNDYGRIAAWDWAVSQIAKSCVEKLGIGRERVRVVYDVQEFDEKCNLWRLGFRTFARARVVLSFDKGSHSGFVTGDLGLMKKTAEDASVELREFVQREMDRRIGVSAGEAKVRFDSIVPDTTFDLITIKFRLL